MTEPVRGTLTDIERTLHMTRSTAGALALSVLVLAAVSIWIPIGRAPSLVFLAAPSALLGLVAPVIGYRLFLWQRERRGEIPDRCAAYARAVLLALAVTEGIAFLGIVVHALTGRAFPLVGVLTHVMLTGAIWPTGEKIEGWIDDEGLEDGRTPS